VLAAGGVFLPVAVIALGGLGLLPTPSSSATVGQTVRDDQVAMAAYGASGIVPQSGDLSAAVLASITSAPVMGADPSVGIPEGALSIPPAALAAYHRAQDAIALQQPGCQLNWTLLAGLGRVISDHGSGDLDLAGNSSHPIEGPRLDGSPGLASIPDTDQGRLDGDTEWDRASGPLQIIPSVWQRVGGDSNGDRYASPHNIYDAALGAGRYLCEDDAVLTGVANQARAVFRYQRSDVFVRAVMAWSQAYGPRLVPGPEPAPVLPPVQQIPPRSTVPPPPGSRPPGAPQPPLSVLPPPVLPPPGSTQFPYPRTTPDPRTMPDPTMTVPPTTKLTTTTTKSTPSRASSGTSTTTVPLSSSVSTPLSSSVPPRSSSRASSSAPPRSSSSPSR
jgi:hypothetical protein